MLYWTVNHCEACKGAGMAELIVLLLLLAVGAGIFLGVTRRAMKGKD